MTHKMPLLNFWVRSKLPLILQTEASECGLACLAMVAGYWGHTIDLVNMRRRFSVSLKGTTLKSLILMAQGLGLQPRPLKLDLPSIMGLKLPCVLHWGMNHFVVLKKVTRNSILIHDPAVGERRLALTEASKYFTGIALELTPNGQFVKANEKQEFSLLSLMGRVEGLSRSFTQLLLLGLAVQVCILIAPFYLQWVVDEVLVSADHDLMTALGIGFLLLVILQTLIGAVRTWIATVLSTNLNFNWLGNAFSHLMSLPFIWFEKRHLGDIVSRFGSIQTIQKNITTQFVEGVIDGLLVIATLCVMFFYSTSLSLISLAAVIIYVSLRYSNFHSLRKATAEQILHTAKQNTHFIESIRGVQSIRLFNRQEERRIGWMNTLADQFNADIKIAKLSISFQTANYLLFNCERIIVIWLASLSVMDNKFSVGMLFAFLSYKDQFSQRFSALIDKLFELKMLQLHGERVADIVLTPPENTFDIVESDFKNFSPAIEVRNVSFRYADCEEYILKNFSLLIPSGQCIAITGASGCGKTTLLKLILGLLEPTSGDIFVSGISIKQFGLFNYRKTLGSVMQEDQLFSGSIFDNISFFDPQPDLEHAQKCAKLSAIHDEIIAMPMSYNTLVGDIGSTLSGGQKQRLLLARALYKNPQILVLDEATSHLDIWNEKLVNSAIADNKMTRILVAHRPETIAMAERVIIVSNGSLHDDSFASSKTSVCPVLSNT